VLWYGIDTVEASFRAQLDPERVEQLEQLKTTAQSKNCPEPVTIGGFEFLVQEKGLRTYPYLLKNEDFHIRVAPEAKGPQLSLRGTSEGLMTYGVDCLYDMMRKATVDLGMFMEAGLSRLDVTVDFQGFAPTREDDENFVCRAKFRNLIFNGQQLQTLQFGKGLRVVRLYDKSAELLSSGKTWLPAVWRRSNKAYNPEEPVWRFEFQLRREALRELGCESAQTAFDNLERLLATGLDWCSLRVPHGVTRSRWLVDPRWEELKQATLALDPLPRLKKEPNLGNVDPLLGMIKGCVVSIAAKTGETNYETAWANIGDMIDARLEQKGESFPALVEERRRRLV
jgi:hypothetical protein